MVRCVAFDQGFNLICLIKKKPEWPKCDSHPGKRNNKKIGEF